jgi:hypothetical protein
MVYFPFPLNNKNPVFLKTKYGVLVKVIEEKLPAI